MLPVMDASMGRVTLHSLLDWVRPLDHFDQCTYPVMLQQDCIEISTLVTYPGKFLGKCSSELLSTVRRLLAAKRPSLQATGLQDFLLIPPDLARKSHFADRSALFKNMLPGNSMITKCYEALLRAGAWTRCHLPVPSRWRFPVTPKTCFGLGHSCLLLPAG